MIITRTCITQFDWRMGVVLGVVGGGIWANIVPNQGRRRYETAINKKKKKKKKRLTRGNQEESK